MDIKAIILTIAASLGLAEKVNKNELTTDDFSKIDDQFKAQTGMSFADAIEKTKTNEQTQRQLEAMLSLFATTDDSQTSDTPGATQQSDVVGALSTKIAEMQEQMKLLAKQEDPQKPETVVIPKSKIVSFAHTATHAFGVELPAYSMDRSWNKNSTSNKKREESYTRQEHEMLMSDFDELTQSVKQRWNSLHESNQLGQLDTLMAAGDINYDDLETEFGKRYLVRRIDAIISQIRKLESISKYFPTRYNVQDKEVVTHSFMGKSFTQAYQAGEIFAGSVKMQPDIYSVADVMFKFKFHDLKDLEREYIGYLNQESSDPMKWAFIEWIMVQCAIIAHNEREMRRVMGVRVEPTPGSATHFAYASNGIIKTMFDKVDSFSAYQFTDLKTYTSSTIVEYVRSLIRKVFVMNGGVLDGYVLVMNAMHVPDFLEGYREKYKSDINFAGEKLEVKDFPLPKIVPINMGDSKMMFMMREGAIELLENKPGEFFAFGFERRLESLFAYSYGKEGVYINAGRRFATQAALTASKGKQTNVFVNHPVTEIADKATAADATINNVFQTVANAAATDFLDFTGAVEGVAYRIYCGGTTNATTVTKAAKFSTITEAYTPTAVGDFLEVIYNPTTSKYVELKRKVGGTITVNANAVAPAYVESI